MSHADTLHLHLNIRGQLLRSSTQESHSNAVGNGQPHAKHTISVYPRRKRSVQSSNCTQCSPRSTEHSSIGNTRQHETRAHVMATRRKGAVSESPCPSAIFEARQDNIWSTLEQTSASEEPGRRQGEQRSCSQQGRRTKKEEQRIAQTINTHKVLLPLVAVKLLVRQTLP